MDPNKLMTREDRQKANAERRNERKRLQSAENASEVRRLGGMKSPARHEGSERDSAKEKPAKKKQKTSSYPGASASGSLPSSAIEDSLQISGSDLPDRSDGI
jgi:hypothetical protein